ncbi:response regulator transcription factor [Streptomyces iconiensis]|uniref:Response regulator transcription factor n=1 Tax=Streptomyces iconiensis TaxID=1384038 RepID=A0ABT6ZXX0_9ACTN|nr:response regulator transcription factor [Streptomyces iconiensis]MDJ1133913.1 response regulator transcription factor [Streptomyces iconiensis]
MRQPLRIVIAEDSVLLREGVVQLLRRFGHEVPAAVGDGPSLLAAAREHRPDLAVVDVRMPPDHTDEGLRAARVLQAEQPDLALLVLSQYVEQTFAEELLAARDSRAGTGYLLKERIGDVEEFTDAVARVAAGATVVDPEVVRQLLAGKGPLERLTPREREVLGLMAEGRSNAAVARRLVVTEAAVAKHIAGILLKLDLPPEAPDDNRRVLAVLTYLRG